MIFEDKVKKLARICWSRGSIDRSVKSGFSEGGHVSDVLKIYLTLSEQEADLRQIQQNGSPRMAQTEKILHDVVPNKLGSRWEMECLLKGLLRVSTSISSTNRKYGRRIREYQVSV